MARTVRWVLIAFCAYLVFFHLSTKGAWVFGPLLVLAVVLGQANQVRLWRQAALSRQAQAKDPVTPDIG
jgi:hypothetical protein